MNHYKTMPPETIIFSFREVIYIHGSDLNYRSKKLDLQTMDTRIILIEKAFGRSAYMYDYMRELQRTFFEEPDCSSLRQEIDVLYQNLTQLLSKGDRRVLLALADQEAALRDEISFASFVAGFRLASGLAMELSREKPFSFDDAEEYRVCAALAQTQEH